MDPGHDANSSVDRSAQPVESAQAIPRLAGGRYPQGAARFIDPADGRRPGLARSGPCRDTCRLASDSPAPRQRHAIEHVVLSLHRATEAHDWPLACQQYIPKDRHEFVLLARSFGQLPSISDCAHALAALDRASHQHPVGPPHFKRITVSRNSAHVRDSQGTASDTVTLPRGSHGWKLVLESVIKRVS
jgi:hypothetical protein